MSNGVWSGVYTMLIVIDADDSLADTNFYYPLPS